MSLFRTIDRIQDRYRVWGYKLRDRIEHIAKNRGVKEIHRPMRMSFRGQTTSLLIVEPEDYLGVDMIEPKAVEKKFETYELIMAECRNTFR